MNRTLIAALLSASVFAASANAGDDHVARLAAEIDRLIAAEWTANNVTPAEPSSDVEFLRRTSLDIAGRIPTVNEVRQFLADDSPSKRERIIDELLESPAFINHYTVRLRDMMLPEIGNDLQLRFLLPGFDSWLRGKLVDGASYSSIVHEILTCELVSRDRNRTIRLTQGEPTPIAFYQAKQIEPENLAAATSRTFLGVRIECAQCHDHPFDSWKRDEFWSMAAFFSGLERQNPQQGVFSPIREVLDRREIDIPNTEDVVQAAFLDGTEPKVRFRDGTRKALADWVTAKDNLYFARAMVNRVWHQFFGVGIVDPVDDFGPANPPSHPKVLDLLAKEFAANDFDLRFLIRVITRTKTWQLSSRRTHDSQSEPRLFSRMSVRGLSPHQIYSSFAVATGLFQPFQIQQVVAVGATDPRSEIFDLFADMASSPNEAQTTILQALSKMNGTGITQATSPQGRVLSSVLSYPFASTQDRIETLYLATLNRPPREEEVSRFLNYVESGGPKNDRNQALGDVYWSLLNSSEFLFNH